MNVKVSIPGTNQILEGRTAKNSAIYTGEITKEGESGTIELYSSTLQNLIWIKILII